MSNDPNSQAPADKQEPIVGRDHPHDGRDWDCHCARCGSSLMFDDCDYCGGSGFTGHDCGEDCCACADPEDNVECQICGGHGTISHCLSAPEWCEAHPLSGREEIESGMPEWFATSNTTAHLRAAKENA